jgi:hypothetical protein
MKKLVLAGLAAFLIGTAAMVPQAEARCWWNGYVWQCWHPNNWRWRRHAWWRYHHQWHPYAYWPYPYAYWPRPYAWWY